MPVQGDAGPAHGIVISYYSYEYTRNITGNKKFVKPFVQKK
jgi:hypothetical protein